MARAKVHSLSCLFYTTKAEKTPLQDASKTTENTPS